MNLPRRPRRHGNQERQRVHVRVVARQVHVVREVERLEEHLHPVMVGERKRLRGAHVESEVREQAEPRCVDCRQVDRLPERVDERELPRDVAAPDGRRQAERPIAGGDAVPSRSGPAWTLNGGPLNAFAMPLN